MTQKQACKKGIGLLYSLVSHTYICLTILYNLPVISLIS